MKLQESFHFQAFLEIHFKVFHTSSFYLITISAFKRKLYNMILSISDMEFFLSINSLFLGKLLNPLTVNVQDVI